MSRHGNFAWVAALLLAAALVSLAVVLQDVRPSSVHGASAPSDRPVAAPSSTGGEAVDRSLESRLETLGQGLAAARGTAASQAGGVASVLPLVLAALGGFGGGLLVRGARSRRRRAEPVVAARTTAEASAFVKDATTPVGGGRAAGNESAERDDRMDGEVTADADDLPDADEVPDADDMPDAEGTADGDEEAEDEVLFSRFEPNAVDLRHRGGLLPWSDEARRPSGTDPSLEARLRSLERTMLRLEQKLEELADAQSEVRGADDRRLAGFARVLAAADRRPADAPRPEAEPANLHDSPDAQRVTRAVRLLADDGWTEERIADRLHLEPEDVLSALPGSRRRRAS